MIVGNGQLAQVFIESDKGDSVIFASGVPNSNCTDTKSFEREKSLLVETLKNSSEKKFVYFSSCVLSAPDYPKNAYYNHKENMEELIKKYSNNYYIFRMPQLFGKLKHHKTLINFLYESILEERKITLYDQAYRYVIEIEDVKSVVLHYLKLSKACLVVDIGNPYRYHVLEIVEILEELLGKKADYCLVQKSDGYLLDFKEMLTFTQKYNLKIDFSKDYLFKKLQNHI
ncbi:MAG: hypothetical protein AB7S77_20650 [Desulfatirhabdiaceae bacterium]